MKTSFVVTSSLPHVHAGNLAREAAKAMNGRGGGNATRGAGSGDCALLPAAQERVRELLAAFDTPPKP
jgi:alanyl-tRNA synthetase